MSPARMRNPAAVLDVGTTIQDLVKVSLNAGVPPEIMELAHLRASQINGCSYCVSAGTRDALRHGFSPEKLVAASAWRESPLFTDAERAALALAETATRLSDRADPVPDAVWDEAARHFDEKQLAALVMWIATANFFNRLNVPVRQPADEQPTAA